MDLDKIGDNEQEHHSPLTKIENTLVNNTDDIYEESGGEVGSTVDQESIQDISRSNSFTYQPAEGEDIYGRFKPSSASSTSQAKYTPPARRLDLRNSIDEVGI